MVQNIRDIRFNRIQELAILRNGIESVEELNWIWMPNLENLNIGTNFIIRIRSVRKLNCPFLSTLNICNSSFTQSTIHSRIMKGSPKLSLLPVSAKWQSSTLTKSPAKGMQDGQSKCKTPKLVRYVVR